MRHSRPETRPLARQIAARFAISAAVKPDVEEGRSDGQRRGGRPGRGELGFRGRLTPEDGEDGHGGEPNQLHGAVTSRLLAKRIDFESWLKAGSREEGEGGKI